MHKDRVKIHCNNPIKPDKMQVLYWMQQTQRIHDNFALEAAIKAANRHELPLKVLFVLTPDFKDANHRHYSFMLEGLLELRPKFERLNIDFVIEIGAFESVLERHLNKAAMFFFDKAYLGFLRTVRKNIVAMSDKLGLFSAEIESDLIVPIEQASSRCEYAARTLRPKLLRLVDTYLDEAEVAMVIQSHPSTDSHSDAELLAWVNTLEKKSSIKKSPYYKGGEDEAIKRLEHFVSEALPNYHESNDPSSDLTSRLSPYLHFGQLSPLLVYRRVQARLDDAYQGAEAFLEQLLVRRELAFNFVYFCPGYDQFETMTYAWAYDTMAVHADDERNPIYTREDYIHFRTHDRYFNAAMKEMVITGHMHNYMRMYWGKKIIEWSPNVLSAYETILYLNNAYFIDGRDPNSYAGVAWLFGRHDRPWQSRAIFGKLRYMNAAGLKRKFDIERYVDTMNKLK